MLQFLLSLLKKHSPENDYENDFKFNFCESFIEKVVENKNNKNLIMNLVEEYKNHERIYFTFKNKFKNAMFEAKTDARLVMLSHYTKLLTRQYPSLFVNPFSIANIIKEFLIKNRACVEQENEFYNYSTKQILKDHKGLKHHYDQVNEFEIGNTKVDHKYNDKFKDLDEKICVSTNINHDIIGDVGKVSDECSVDNGSVENNIDTNNKNNNNNKKNNNNNTNNNNNNNNNNVDIKTNSNNNTDSKKK
jgi:hypothetical protein